MRDSDPLLARTQSNASRLAPTSLVTGPGSNMRPARASEDMAAIRAELAGVRGSLQPMSKKLDDILHIVKWVLPHF